MRRVLTPLLVVSLCCCCLHLNAQETAENGAPEIAVQATSNHVSIANDVLRGQPIHLIAENSLEGWTDSNGKPPKAGWSVSDGVLSRNETQGGDLYHKHWYRDFELTFEWKISEGGNSGIKYRVQDYGKQKLGCEYQLQDDKGKDYDKHATGALYAIYEPGKNKVPIVPMQWNISKIVVCGNVIEHWLNGELVVQAEVGRLEWLQRVKKSKFNDKPYFGQNRNGRLFLQDHGHPVWFRNIVVTPLDCDVKGFATRR